EEGRRDMARPIPDDSLEESDSLGLPLAIEGELRQLEPRGRESLVGLERPPELLLGPSRLLLGEEEPAEQREGDGVPGVGLHDALQIANRLVAPLLPGEDRHLRGHGGWVPGIALEDRLVLSQRALGIL